MAAKRQRLAARRKAVSLTQEQLAERLGVERSTVVRWERGDTAPLPWIRPKLGRALHVSVDQVDQLLAVAPAQEPGAVTGATGTAASAVDERGTHIEQRRQEQAGTTIPADDTTTIAVGQVLAALLAEAYAALATAGVVPLSDVLRTATAPPPLGDGDPRGVPDVYESTPGSSSIPVNSAKRYCQQARGAAHNAGSVDLGIYALCEWSYTDSWQGQAPTGLDLAAAAQSLMASAEDPLMRVGPAQRAAMGNAHLQSGEIDEAARVVGDATGLAVQTRSARLVKELRATRVRMQPCRTLMLSRNWTIASRLMA
jgi:DNA-binding XRE family transcriptional regulator